MQGLELSRRFFREYGLPMLREKFPDLLPRIAAGLTGSGSECFGYDDEVSADHDFEPGFCLFLPEEETVDRRTAFLLERAYAALPKEYLGFRRAALQPAGGNRHGVFRTRAFFLAKAGTPDGDLSVRQWLTTPQSVLAEAVNGEIFHDGPGEVTGIRRRLAAMPEDIRRKRLAGHLFLMGQAGQYNYARCLAHGETGAAQLAAVQFVQSLMECVFLLNRVYMPYYKWSFRAMRALPELSGLADSAEYLLTTGNTGETAETKQYLIEEAAGLVIAVLQERQMTEAVCGDLEKHAYSVNDSVADSGIRNLHILASV